MINKVRIRLTACDGGYESKDYVYPDGSPMSARDAIDRVANPDDHRLVDYKPAKPTHDYQHWVGRIRMF